MAINNSYTGAALDAASGAQFIPEVWVNEILGFREAQTIGMDMVKIIASSGNNKKGDTFHIPRMFELGVEDKVANQPVTLQANTDTDLVVNITTDKVVSFGIDSYLDMVSAYDVRKPYLSAMAYAIDKDFTGELLGLRAAVHSIAAQNVFCSSNGLVTGNGLPFNFASFLTARQRLLEANVPMEDICLYVSPGQETALMNINQFISADFINNKPLVNGQIGTLMGVKIVRTTLIAANSLTGWANGKNQPNLPTPGVAGSMYLPKQDTFTALPLTFTGNSLPIHTAIMCNKEWACAVQPGIMKVSQSWENMLQLWAFVQRNVYGARLYRPDHAVLIHTTGGL